MKPLHDYTGRVCSSLFGVGNAGVMQQVFAAAFTDLVARVEALEAAQNLQQRDEDTERAAPTVKDSLTVGGLVERVCNAMSIYEPIEGNARAADSHWITVAILRDEAKR